MNKAGMKKDSRIFVAGHKGLAGSAIYRRLHAAGYRNLVLRSRSELDLRDRGAVESFFTQEKPEYVILAAAKVGGILANSTYPAEFLFDNLSVQNNVIDASARYGVKKLAFLGSSCIYPKYAAQPMREEYLLTGELEPTNEWYAVAKIAGIKMAQAYRKQYGLNAISLMPTNLYGPEDNFDLNSSHVLPALLRKTHEAITSNAPELVVWGTGKPLREFLHADDLADAVLYLMLHYDEPEIINVGSGSEISIGALAELIVRVTGCRSRLVFDSSKPDGTPRKLLDTSRLTALGWKPRIGLEEGIASAYRWYVEKHTPRAARG
jgi:GDP-L-fucose synthase